MIVIKELAKENRAVEIGIKFHWFSLINTKSQMVKRHKFRERTS